MKLAFIGTGKIIADALYAVEPIEELERTAIFARPHSRQKAEDFAREYGIKEIYTDSRHGIYRTDQQCPLQLR